MDSFGAVRMDSKGRVTIPREARERLGLAPGSLLFLREEGQTLCFARADNPFDALAAEALEDYRQGKTRELSEIAAEWGVSLSGE